MLIDTFSGLPDRRVLGSWLRCFTPYAGYVRQFANKMAPAMGITTGQLNDLFAKQGIADTVEKMMDAMDDAFMDLDAYIAVMDALEIQAQGIWLHVEPGEIFSQPAVQAVSEAVEKHPERFFLLPSFDLSPDIADRVQAFHDRIGLAGVTTLAFIDGVFPDDKAYAPLYEKLVELQGVLWNHTVNSWSSDHVSEFGHPRYVDRIACKYPDLRIVQGHGGWPWVLEALTVARRHPNVYIEPSSHRWKHLARPGSGWEPLMYYGNWVAADKVLFGSIWQLQGLPVSMVIDEVRALPLSEKTLAKWTYENAKRLYRL
jgi:predicted TIM-barrel fold metal-dependent hydrolase